MTDAATRPAALPRVFWLLWAGMLINRLGGGVFCFLSVYLTRARGLTPAQAGLVLGLFAGGGMVAGPLGGLLADRLGRRATLLISSAFTAVVMIALGLARRLELIAVVAPLLGFFTDLARPALQAAVADLVPPPERRRAYGLLYWAINLGFSGAAALAGKLAQTNFGLLFVVDAATTALFGALVFFAVPETRPTEAVPPPSYLGQLVVPFRDGRFLRFALVQGLVLCLFVQFISNVTLAMADRGLSTEALGGIMALNGIVIVVLQPVALRVFAHTPHHRLLAGAAVTLGVGLGMVALAAVLRPVPVFVSALVVMTCGEISFSIAVPALLAELAPPEHRGGYQGAYQLTWGLAMLAAPTLGALVLQTFGATPLWLGCLGVGLVAGFLHMTVARQNPTDSAH